VTEQSGWDNLKEDGKDMNNVFFVGNTMIDSLKAFNKEIQSKKFSFTYNEDRPYLAMTLHRPSNVDNKEGLLKILSLLKHCSEHFQVIFPMHPRTKKNIDNFNLIKDFEAVKGVVYTDPLDYFTFQKLIACADGVITDSGGIQEETTFIGIPCVTLRENTERPITIDIGTNELMDFDPPKILNKLKELGSKPNQVPPLWDGNATQRIAEKLNEIYSV
jgi:UDP-N-acetylglucosamine 2-epimerase (non-hydrolysing)